MNLNKEFRDPKLVQGLVEKITGMVHRPVTLMEVCGTHTVAIFRHGIRNLLGDKVRMLSGPGCPVCVTSHRAIDEALAIAARPEVIFTTFGDMMRVPGSKGSLSTAKAGGADVRTVYSPLDAVNIARDNPGKEVVFFAIGFETTSPTIAATVLSARDMGLTNFSIIGSHKLIPAALRALLSSGDINLDGLILPGHVSAMLGVEPYQFIAEEFNLPSVITGFEPVDILQGIYLILKQIQEGKPRVDVQYTRGVPIPGNPRAMEILLEVFEVSDDYWRGIGVIPCTGLKVRKEFSHFDAKEKFNVSVPEVKEPPGCRCGHVLRGMITPLECPLFNKACTPESPVGACMVSLEGTCAAYHKYGM